MKVRSELMPVAVPCAPPPREAIVVLFPRHIVRAFLANL